MDSNNSMSCIFCSALLMFFFTSKTLLCSVVANNTISSGQSLSGNQTIVSQNGNFELGFFTPGKSNKYYMGIWYTEASAENRMVVWVANRDHPLNDLLSSELKLFDNGNLVLLNDLKMPIWSTNSTSKAFKSSTAVLGDDGNLVLRDGSSIILWQSFDHPTNTLLAGAKLGYDKRAKMAAQKLTSWRNSEDPAHGIYSVQSEGPGGNFEVRWNGSAAYWSTDAWNTDSFYSTIKLRSILNSFNFSFISNENESYFTFSPKDKSVLDFVMLDLNGQLKSYFLVKKMQSWNLIWYQPTLQCQVYGFCGDFGVCRENSLPVCQCLPGFKQHHPKDWDLLDYSGGCVRETSLQCGGKDWFLKVHNVRLPVNSKASRVEKAENCKLACSNNCSCTAYAYTSAGCLTWHGNLLNIQQLDTDGDDLYLRLAASEVSSSGRKVSVLPVAIGVVSGMIALAVISVLVVFSRLRRMKRKVNTSVTEEDNSPGPMHHYTFLTAFEYKQLKVATKNFSDKLGSGGFGSVLKGVLPDSTPIAVKKLDGISQGEKQFRSEVSTLGLVQHVNLVRLLGFCSGGNNRMLVYDFMSNGSLDSHLFSQDDSKVLNWSTRHQIAVGIARGLAYLHEQCRDCIIHCDIKPENILLDADFTPKVADFGLAKILGHEFSRVLTTFRGTVGYLAPEWTTGVAITTKADVYSYGMMLFEIISGRRNMKQHVNGKMCFFPTWAANKVLSKGHEVLCILDEKLERIADVEELTRAFSVACWCIQEEEIQRPSMGQIVQILDGLLEVNSPPIPKYLQALLENEETISFFSE
ncbi:hypothetical protein Scep_013228 [Stephania cephalantha]|uniref:Receptor-like serine/threonine-protein kinase n=1 Tax=Stephania cephalantha TaxID=152367 RepID=A0AAP0JHF6_9MAGN